MKPDEWLMSVLVDEELAYSIKSSIEKLISILERGLENIYVFNSRSMKIHDITSRFLFAQQNHN